MCISVPDMVFFCYSDDEGRDLVGKRGSEFKLPYPIIDTDTTGLGSPLMEEDMNKKSPRNKKSKNQLRDYLHTGRKRKTPYRDAFNGINGYTPYTPLNGYPTCGPTGEVKSTDIMYPYAGNNFGLDTATDLYARTAAAGYTSFPTTGLYPTTADSFRLEADKHAYSNGYYLEPRQYQHTLQYHGNGYSDYMAQAGAKYPYDLKYGYEHMSSAYGLDLSKRTPYEEEMAKYETDIRKYSHDYASSSSASVSTAADKYSRINGSLDSRTSSLYGTTTPLLNSDGLGACSTALSHSTASPCSVYRGAADGSSSSTGSVGINGGGMTSVSASAASHHSDRYDSLSVMAGKETKPLIDTSVDIKSTMPNGHASVIRNASPRTKSPRNDRSSAGTTSGLYGEGATSVLTSCGNATWPVNIQPINYPRV